MELRLVLHGRETRRRFDTPEEAVVFRDAEKAKADSLGAGAAALTPGQFGRLLTLLHKIGGGEEHIAEGLDRLEAAAKFYERHCPEDTKPKMVGEVVDSMLSLWRSENKNKDYIRNGGGICRRFGQDFSTRPISLVTPAEVQKWVLTQAMGVQLASKARLSALFAHAALNGWITQNPCSLFSLPKRKRKAVEVPSPHEIRRFLALASLPEWNALLPYFCLRFFCGVRQEEAEKLEWSHVDLGRKILSVPVGVAAKGGPARTVPIADNLFDWLVCHKPTEPAKIAPANLKRLENNFRKMGGFVGPLWMNALRHAYGSYRYPVLGNFDVLAGEMGNSRRVLSDHYVGAVDPADVPIFWSLTPKGLTMPTVADS